MEERKPSSLRHEVEVEEGEVREVTREARENAKAVLMVSYITSGSHCFQALSTAFY
jgi:hypothetical protein